MGFMVFSGTIEWWERMVYVNYEKLCYGECTNWSKLTGLNVDCCDAQEMIAECTYTKHCMGEGAE